MPEITSSAHIASDVESVYRLARDIERFSDYMPDVKSIDILERSEDSSRVVAAWVGLVQEFKLTVKWVEEDIWNDAERTCRFRLVKGDFKVYEGSWRFTEEDGGSRFTSTLTYEYDLPLIGPIIKNLIKKKMQENSDKIVEAIRRKAESGE
ncbi:MAG: SRPBCC family protein [Armatimonadetes bacterium]|nr:SRPBCC family protein [Armatimonadota bacterium]